MGINFCHWTNSFPNPNQHQVQLSPNVQAALREVVLCEVAEGVGVGEVAEGHLEDEEVLEIGEEEGVLAEGVEAVLVSVAAAVAVEMQTSQDRREDFEEGAHSL